jgi:LysR family transcriptional regulator, low CO2-responsive transcriptional regulator
MPRPRLVNRHTRASGRRRLVQAPQASTIPASVETLPYAAASGAPRLATVNSGAGLHQVQMENVPALRLRLLLEIDRTGSISAAAERCAIGQPSASKHVRTLETAIGHRLVIRNGRGSRLTPAGKIVASHAARIVSTLGSMRSALDALHVPSSGELTLAASHTGSLVLIPAILRDFSERYPAVSVKVRTLPSAIVVREVGRAAADVGVAGDVASSEPVVRHQILIDELVGLAGVGLLSSKGEPVSRAEFARHSLLLGPDESSTRMVTERHLGRADYRPARIWAFDSCETIKRAVADGLGVTFMSQLLVKDEIERGELVPFVISGVERMLRPIHALQPSLVEPTAHAAGFTTLLIDAHRTPDVANRSFGRQSSRRPEAGRSSPST